MKIISIFLTIFLCCLMCNNVVANSGKVLFYIKDHLGSTRMTIDRDGSGVSSIKETRSYYPFGKEMPGKTDVVENRTTTERFTGKELDAQTELSYFGARYYNAEIGRWLSIDPSEQFASGYIYTGNGANPVFGYDSNGEEFKPGMLYKKHLMSCADDVINSGNQYAAYLNEISTDIFIQSMGPGDLLGMALYSHDIYISDPIEGVMVQLLGQELAQSTAMAWEIGNMYGIVKEQESGVNAQRYGVTADYKEAYLSANYHLAKEGSKYRMGFNTTQNTPDIYEVGNKPSDVQEVK